MKKILLILFLFPISIWSQKTSIIKGFVKDSNNNSIENVSVKYGETGTTTNAEGFYQIRIPFRIPANGVQKFTIIPLFVFM